MTEEIRKIDAYNVEVFEPQKVVLESVTATKTLDELEKDLQQAIDSRVYAYEQTIKPIDDTIALFQLRVDQAKAQGVVVKPIEVVKEILISK